MRVMVSRGCADNRTNCCSTRVAMADSVTHRTADDGADDGWREMVMMPGLNVNVCTVCRRVAVVVAHPHRLMVRAMVVMPPAVTNLPIVRSIGLAVKLVVFPVVNPVVVARVDTGVESAIRGHCTRGAAGED